LTAPDIGDYIVSAVTPSGMTPTTAPSTSPLTMSLETHQTADFGFRGPGTTASWLRTLSASRAADGGVVVHWRVATQANLIGFELTSGSVRLTPRLIAVHRSDRYTTVVTAHRGAVLSLRALMKNGRWQTAAQTRVPAH
jgi:hypothetical protein